MRATSPTPSGRPLVSHDAYTTVFGLAYAGLATNFLIVGTCLPFLVALVTTDPSRSWPLLVLLAPSCAPAVVAAFAVFGEYSADSSTPVVRTFWRSYRRHGRRSLAIGVIATCVSVVLAVDVRAAWGHAVGAVAIPVLVTMLVLTAVTTVVALPAVPDHPDVRLRDLLKAALFAAVRRYYLSGFALVVLGTLAAVVAARPALGLGAAMAPLLYVVWAGSRHAMSAVVAATSTPAEPATRA